MTGTSGKKLIWLVQIGEELPCDPGPPRLLRTALLARELSRRGHRIRFWNASFNHQQKVQRLWRTETFPIDAGYDVTLLYGRAYRRNVSIARIRSHQENARAFRTKVALETVPDVIVCGLPSLELADAASAYGAERGVPVIIDCRDMWPDVIAEQLPAVARFVAAPVLRQWERMRRRILSRATGITGITEAFVDWGLAGAGRRRTPLDKAFHLAIADQRPESEDIKQAQGFWDARLGRRTEAAITGVFAGILSRRSDLSTIIAAMRSLPLATRADLRIVVCGRGDLEQELRQLAGDDPGIVFAGWRNAAELHALMTRCDFGILPYPSSPDFRASFPNKVGEYLSFGLPIMTGLAGVTRTMLQERGLELRYEIGNVASVAELLAGIAQGRFDLGSVRERACRAFDDLFDPRKIFPAFADYVETVADRVVAPVKSEFR